MLLTNTDTTSEDDKTEREAFPCGKKYQRKQPVGGGWDMGNVACFLLLLCIHKKYSYVKGHAVQHKEMKHAPMKSLQKCQKKNIYG